MDTGVKVGWAGFGGAGRDTSEGDAERANGSVSSSPSGSSWIRSISIQSILPTPFCSALIANFFCQLFIHFLDKLL